MLSVHLSIYMSIIDWLSLSDVYSYLFICVSLSLKPSTGVLHILPHVPEPWVEWGYMSRVVGDMSRSYPHVPEPWVEWGICLGSWGICPGPRVMRGGGDISRCPSLFPVLQLTPSPALRQVGLTLSCVFLHWDARLTGTCWSPSARIARVRYILNHVMHICFKNHLIFSLFFLFFLLLSFLQLT